MATSIFALALSPLELAAQHVEECAAGVQELHLMFRFAATDVIAVKDRHACLAVDAAEVLVERDSAGLIWRRETFGDLFGPEVGGKEKAFTTKDTKVH